jgi:hypothetical protein
MLDKMAKKNGGTDLCKGVAERVSRVGGDDQGGVAVVGKLDGERSRTTSLSNASFSPEHVVLPLRANSHLLKPLGGVGWGRDCPN